MSFRRGSDFSYSSATTIEYEESYLCCFCRKPALDPVAVEQGTKMACAACAAALSMETTNVADSVAAVLDNVKAVCPMCGKHVRRNELSSHVESCSAPCAAGCGQSVLLRCIETHASQCTMALTRCSAGCKWNGQRRFLKQHRAKCPFVQLKPDISMMLTRIDHLSTDLQTANVGREELQSQCEAMRELLQQHQKKIEELQSHGSDSENPEK
jgi:hypothetical protein